ncbi:MAG: amidohydrolase family protein [Rhodospirillaceae bacterium]
MANAKAWATNNDWLDLNVEETLEPDLPICDPHHHLWEFRHERAAHRYLLDEIQSDLNSSHNIVSTVFIECGAMYKTDGPEHLRSVGEVEFVNGVAAMSASGLYGKTRVCAGIIGNANLRLGAKTGEVLDALEAAGGGRFRGIRHQASWDEHGAASAGRFVTGPHTYLDTDFRSGFAELGKRGLSFEGWCYHPQIHELTDLARSFPEVTIILNHFGGPLGRGVYAGKRDEIFPEWQKDIAALAECENVVAKLGGIYMELNGFDWHERERPAGSAEMLAATRRYYEHTLDCFGVERCLFESNFPVDRVSCSYNTCWNIFKRLAADYSADEKAALFHDNATRVYRL